MSNNFCNILVFFRKYGIITYHKEKEDRMVRILRSREGFTLVELIVVIVIIGILAAVAAPIMSGNVNRARRSEAVAALGAIRTADRLYFAENTVHAAGIANLSPYLNQSDLNGPNYNSGNYSIASGNVVATGAAANGGSCSMDINTGALNGA